MHVRRGNAQARAAVKSGRTYGESNCHGKVGYHVYNKTWEAADGEAVDGEALVHVRKIARKRFRSINCGCERGIVIGHLPRKLAVAGVFAVFGMGRYYRMYSTPCSSKKNLCTL